MAIFFNDMMIIIWYMYVYIYTIITYTVEIILYPYCISSNDIAALVRISSTSERNFKKTDVKDRWFIRNHGCIVFTHRKPMELRTEYGWPRQGQLRVKSCGVARYILKGVVFAALGQKTGRVAAPGTVFLSTFGREVWKGTSNLSLIQFWPIRNGFIVGSVL